MSHLKLGLKTGVQIEPRFTIRAKIRRTNCVAFILGPETGVQVVSRFELGPKSGVQIESRFRLGPTLGVPMYRILELGPKSGVKIVAFRIRAKDKRTNCVAFKVWTKIRRKNCVPVFHTPHNPRNHYRILRDPPKSPMTPCPTLAVPQKWNYPQSTSSPANPMTAEGFIQWVGHFLVPRFPSYPTTPTLLPNSENRDESNRVP